MSEKKQPPVRVRFAGITNCEWKTQVNDYGMTDVVNSDGFVIASVMPVPGDTPDFKFRRIHAEIIALSGYLISMPEVQNDECVISTLETIDTILNEQQ